MYMCKRCRNVINTCSMMTNEFDDICNVSSTVWVFSLFPSLFPFSRNEQYLEKANILCCKSSMAWLTIQTIFGESVIFNVNPSCHGWWYKAIWWVQCIAKMCFKLFSIVCDKPNATVWQIMKTSFCLLFIVYRTNFH